MADDGSRCLPDEAEWSREGENAKQAGVFLGGQGEEACAGGVRSEDPPPSFWSPSFFWWGRGSSGPRRTFWSQRDPS